LVWGKNGARARMLCGRTEEARRELRLAERLTGAVER
jgi:hypothetical protein